MLTAAEIRDRVLRGLASGKLWRLAQDQARTREGSATPCYVCEERIRPGQAYELRGKAFPVVVHLECYLFWLHLSGVYEPEPITCAACRRVIPLHAEKTMVEDAPYHTRCWDRSGSARSEAK